MLDADCEAVKKAADSEFDFRLNFNEDEDPDGYVFIDYDSIALPTDGNDRFFGDVANDWIVGSTGRDHMWSGRGDNLMNMDNNHDSGSGGKTKPYDPLTDPLDNT